MKSTRTIVVVAVAIFAAVAIAVIVRSTFDRTNLNRGKKLRIGYVVTTLSNPFFVEMANGAREAIRELPDAEVVVQAPEQAADNERQIQIVENLIVQRVDAICVVPADSKSIAVAVAKANNARIPVINVDNRMDASSLTANNATVAGFVGSDNASGGKVAGEYVIEKLKGKGKVAILEGVSGVEAGAQRKAGFMEALKSAPGIHVVASQPADWSREKGLNVFQGIYQAHPDLAALFACNDEMALGAIRALPQPRKVVVVGFDATKDAIEAIQLGQMDATVAQVPREMGRIAVGMAIKAARGEQVDREQATPLKLVTKDGKGSE